MSVNLTESNKDYAVFLPSISGFYQNFISKEMNGEGIPTDRVPAGFDKGVYGCNWLDAENSYYNYKWSLYSAGHAQLDTVKSDTEEAMVQKRDRPNTFILGDSGGFQIAKGVIKLDWQNFYETPNQPNYVGKADKLRQSLQNWLEHTADYSMVLDVPTFSALPPLNKRTGLNSFQECLDATLFNNDWFVRNAQGKTKYLNVLQGGSDSEADTWYDQVKNYPFQGWAMGGNNMQDMKLFLRRMITLRDDKLLEKGERDLIHVLGTGKLEWAVMLTAIKRKLQERVNSNLEITFDCASPFLCTANGQFYTNWRLDQDSKWSYMMNDAPDDKSCKGHGVLFDDEARKMYPDYIGSPVTNGMMLDEICYYAPGDVSRMGNETKTSWDSFSYCMLMGHNVWQHVKSVQEANKAFDQGQYPTMMVDNSFDKQEVKDVVMEVFAESDKGKSLQIIENHRKLWMKVIGTRGAVGKKTINSSAQFNALFS